METDDSAIANNPHSISLREYMGNIAGKVPKKEAEMMVTISNHLARFLGPNLEIPNRAMLADLPNRFAVFLRGEGKPSNTIKNYVYRTRLMLKLICGHCPELKGLDSLPAQMPEFPEGESKREKRLLVSYRVHSQWRAKNKIPLTQTGKTVSLKYQKDLLRNMNYKYLTARVRYTDLQTYWAEKSAAWELPIAELPDMKSERVSRTGILKRHWPEKIRQEIDWYFACCRGEVRNAPFQVKRFRGYHCERNLETELRLFLGFLRDEKGYALDSEDLRTVLKKDRELRDFVEWHRSAKKGGNVATLHKRIFNDFAIVLDEVWGDPIADDYRKWAKQLKPKRVRIKFQSTISSHGELLELVQDLLERTKRMCDDFIVTKWESSSEHQRAAIATSYQDALMFATYCLVPIRESNMLGLELQVSLLRNDAGGYDICIGMMDFKSRFIFKIQFPSVLQEYLEDFIERWRPILNKRNDNYLFHTRTGGLLRYKAANDRMIAIGKNLCGIHTNPHHFRMLCASAYLSDHPEEFEQVRQLLGHKYIRTTVEQYTHLFSLNASRKAAVFARETAPDFSNLCSGLPLNERVQDAVRRYSPKATGSGN